MKSKIILFLFAVETLLYAQAKEKISEQPGYMISEFIFPLGDKPTPQCHASTIASTPDGLIAAWFGGTEEKNPDVGIWIYRNVNGKWNSPIETVNGIQENGNRYACWNPVLFYEDGNLLLFYKVGPDPINWWGMVITSGDNGATWSRPERLSENILGPIKNKPLKLPNGEIISPSSTENNGWKVHVELSNDHGKTWNKIEVDCKKFSVIQPSILLCGKDTLQMLCRSKDGFIIQSRSYDNGKTWSEMKPINLPNPNSGIDAVTLKDGRHLLVYNHTGMIDGKWGGKRTPLNVAISKDGINWQQILTLEDEPGEYSYTVVIQTEDGLVHITYTFKRETIKHVVVDPLKVKNQ